MTSSPLLSIVLVVPNKAVNKQSMVADRGGSPAGTVMAGGRLLSDSRDANEISHSLAVEEI